MAEHTPPACAEVTTPKKGVKRKAVAASWVKRGRGKGVMAAELPSGLPIDDDKILQAQAQLRVSRIP